MKPTIKPTVLPAKSLILVVDDDSDLVKGLARILRSQGFSVLEAVGGRQALDMGKKECPQVAIMDIIMPDLNGIEVFHCIRQICPKVKGIFMTGSSEYNTAAHEAGCITVLEKPIDHDQLLKTLTELMCE